MKRIFILTLAASFISFAACSSDDGKATTEKPTPIEQQPTEPITTEPTPTEPIKIDTAKLDAFFDVLERADRLMGSIAISHDGKPIYQKSIGFSDIEKNIKMNENSKCRIASISKTFTAVLVLKAIEAGKLSLNQTIAATFPKIENADKITIEHLLYQRSGLGPYEDALLEEMGGAPTYDAYVDWVTQLKERDQMVALISKTKSIFEPGTEHDYQNMNFILLSYLLEDAYQKPYAEILEEQITKPLGLTNTRLGQNNGECRSYIPAGSWKADPQLHSSIVLGTGGLVSTPLDLIQFIEALSSGKLISPENLERMKTIKDGYGMGLFDFSLVFPSGEKIVGYGHSGSVMSFRSFLVHLPERKISFSYIFNAFNYPLYKVYMAILSTLFDIPFPFELPEFYDISTVDLDPYLGTYSTTATLPPEFAPLASLVIKKSDNNKKLVMEIKGFEHITETLQFVFSDFSMEATGKDEFETTLGDLDVVLKFNLTKGTMKLETPEGTLLYTQ